MSKVTRGEKIMNKLTAEQILSPTGKDWLLASLDPFHDNQLANIEGWPDTECGASVVRCVKQSVTVSKPTTGLPAGNFDVHIIMWPMIKAAEYVSTVNRAQNLLQLPTIPVSDPAQHFTCGGLQIWAVPSGKTLTNYLDVDAILLATLELDNDYTQGSGRLIGMGYEVHNTTSDLYRQGSVACYRQQAVTRDPATFNANSTLTAGSIPLSTPVTLVVLRHPPMDTEQAMLLQGSRQWTAEEGVYQVAAFHSDENSAYPISVNTPAISRNGEDDEEGRINVGALYVPFPAYGGAQFGTNMTFNPIRVHPVHQSGSIFSGLSEQTTLTINYNVFYESFPSFAEKPILALAKPSAVYDPRAMELYSRIVQELPVGVPVCENGLGDWFLDAASTAAKYIGPVLAALPHPIAKGAGTALTYLGETGQNYVKRQVPPNAWEQKSGGGDSTAKEMKAMMNQAKQQQKHADQKQAKKKAAKAKAKARR